MGTSNAGNEQEGEAAKGNQTTRDHVYTRSVAILPSLGNLTPFRQFPARIPNVGPFLLRQSRYDLPGSCVLISFFGPVDSTHVFIKSAALVASAWVSGGNTTGLRSRSYRPL